jgi:hypothetical protein
MRVQKVSSKTAKKNSKLDSVKSPGLGSSLAASSGTKKSTQVTHKTGSVHKKGASTPSKTSGKVRTTVTPSHKSMILEQTQGKNLTSASKKNAGSVAGRSSLESGETVCREVACEGLATSGGYCRLHYIKNWKKIKRKELILREKKLNQYIEELVAKYPDKYIEAIRQDLANDKDFAKVIYDLDLDEGVDDFDVEGGDSVDSLIDTIKRDFDDEGESF